MQLSSGEVREWCCGIGLIASCVPVVVGEVSLLRAAPHYFVSRMYDSGVIMQQSVNDGNDPCSVMDDYLLGDILQKIVSCKVDCIDLVDFANSLALEPELSNGNMIYDAELPPYTDWQRCDRLLPDDEMSIDESQQNLLSAGYSDCMDEAIRFLVEEEEMAPEHPLVRNLKAHLEDARDRVLSAACDGDLDNNNISRTPCVPQGLSYEFCASLNIVQSPILSNTG